MPLVVQRDVSEIGCRHGPILRGGQNARAPPDTPTGGEALEAKVVKVTDKATEKKPITIEFHQDSGAWHPDGSEPLVDNSTFFNFQVVSKKKLALLNLRADWGYPTASDLDYYLFDGTGAEIGSSTAFNPLPAVNQSTGGEGFEFIEGMPAPRCDGFTLESRPYFGPTGEDVTLTVWLG